MICQVEKIDPIGQSAVQNLNIILTTAKGFCQSSV